MMSEKILRDEIRLTKIELKQRIKEGDWEEAARLSSALETMEFVLKWEEE